jgi:hypothetical protein
MLYYYYVVHIVLYTHPPNDATAVNAVVVMIVKVSPATQLYMQLPEHITFPVPAAALHKNMVSDAEPVLLT